MPGFELFGSEERKEVQDVLETGILMRYNFDALRNNIWKAKDLESAISKDLGVKHVQLTSSGTTALITAMNVAGIGAYDEVIMPAYTFVASFEAVLAVGAIPVLVDIDDTLTLDPKAVEKAITSKTKAIMPVHMSGSMADLDPLIHICKQHSLILLEDACQAIGATYKGKPLGTIGDIGCYSFDFVKTVTCGEGGAVLTNNTDYYIHSDQYTDHGHDHVGSDRGAESHPILGLNYRISELHAAVGLAQWRKLPQILEIQRRNKGIIKQQLTNVEGLEFRRIPDPEGDNASFLSFFLPDEESARKATKALKEAGVPGVFYWFDNNWHYIKKWEHLKEMKTLAPLYQEHKDALPNYSQVDFSQSDGIMGRLVTLLISLSWTEEETTALGEKMVTVLNTL